MNPIVVVGSYNVGLTVTVPRIPVAGETILGSRFDMGPGGKGSNQAMAVARLGGKPAFIARVGSDQFGAEALAMYRAEGIDTAHVVVDEQEHTGAGIIFVDSRAQNSIGVALGANSRLCAADIDRSERVFVKGGFLLVQLESPIETVKYAMDLAARRGMRIVLNPAPARKLPDGFLDTVEIVTPNETETEILTGRRVTSQQDAAEAGRILLAMGARVALITLGGNGAMLVTAAGARHFEPYPVTAVDTTGAGDAFNGGLVYALARGQTLEDAVEFASRVGALSVQHVGVIPGLPTCAAVEALRR